MKIYLVIHSVDYEGNNILSVHSTKFGALNAVKDKAKEYYDRYSKYGDYELTEDGQVRVADSTFYVLEHEVLP